MVTLADGTRALEAYWTTGEGAAKIRWGTDGAFDRCVNQLRDKVTDPEGLCATYEKKATGSWPAEKKAESTGETVQLHADVETVQPETVDEELSDEWHGILTVEGIDTGDGRYFRANSLTWPDLPLPLRWCPVDTGGHDNAVRVGNIERIERRPTSQPDVFEIWGHGTFDVADDEGRKIRDKMARGYASGNSVDVDSIKDADVEFVFADGATFADGAHPELTIFNKGRIRATTLVDIPAFVEAKVQLGRERREELYGLVAAGAIACPDFLLLYGREEGAPLVAAAVGGDWDPGVHFSQLTAGGTMQLVPADTAREYFAYTPPALPDGTVNVGECRYLHHTVTADGTPGLPNLTACAAGIHALNARPGRLTALELRQAYNHLAGHLEAARYPVPPFTAVTESMVAAAAITLADAPPAEWFTDPQLPGPTGLTVTDDGRVFGHGALWGTCHTGFGNACVAPPEELSHDYYRLGEVLCAGGERVAVGQITLGTGHAATSGVSWRGAMEHYDNTGSVVADVATGNDEHGIWVSGALRPGVTAGQVRELMGAKLSGDWRKIAGQLRLVAFLAVNVPGFPVPRTRAGVFAGEQLSLVAAGHVGEEEPPPVVEQSVPADGVVAAAVAEVDREEAGRARAALLRRLCRDPQSMRAALAARLGA